MGTGLQGQACEWRSLALLDRGRLPQEAMDSLPPLDDHRWKTRRREVARAIKQAHASAPGPDGIPYLAWQRLGDLAIDILHLAGKELEKDDFRNRLLDMEGEGAIQHAFNLGALACIPKGCTDDPPEASSTRPLSIVNTDNRILASSRRLRWEPLFEAWISNMQQGFLKGRSMLSNVIDLEMIAMELASKSQDAALLLFDFRAAFPSMSQEFLLDILKALPLPTEVLNFVGALYDDTRCEIGLAGRKFPGFHLSAGIRQGCPLSPLLFAVAMDILLRRIRRLCPTASTRAFADDTAVVLRSLREDGPTVARIFNEFGDISGMHLNIPKCMLIPLWLDSVGNAANQMTTWVPDWASFKVSFWGKYLGYAIGPEKKAHMWQAALAKVVDRARLWAPLGLGLHYNAIVFNTYVVSVLSFLMQLARPPKELDKAIQTALRLLASGPGNWAQPVDLYNLEENYGQVRSFSNPLTIATAAKIRVALYEAEAAGGLRVRSRAADFRTMRAQNPLDHWDEWLDEAPILILEEALNTFTATCRITPTQISSEIRVPRGTETQEDADKRTKANIQKTATERINRMGRPLAEDRMRERLERWHLPGLPLRTARASLRRFRRLRDLGPPRLNAAMLSSAWNRWCTQRRFGQQGCCVLGCRGEEDSIEHYSRCSVVRTFAANFLRLRYPAHRGKELMTATAPELDDDTALLRCAVLVYAAWRHTEATRKEGAQTRPANFHTHALQQAAREAVRGHAKARAILDRGALPTVLP